MATNIEQIFRSFVVSKFREIQEQQFGSGKIGNQHNGEINASGQVNSSDDTINSIESLQNDSLVQKIEQVLSEVLSTEPQYRSGGEDIVRTISHSAKRGLSEEVQDEVPRKKSKKDKKHKDKKKKKKRKKEKKEKKYKKHDKETDIQQRECEDMPHVSQSSSAEDDIEIPPLSAFKDFSWVKEQSIYENLNSTTADSQDTRKLETSKEESALINIQEINEVNFANDKELENDTYRSTNVTVNVGIEDESLNIMDAEGSAVCIVIEGSLDIKETEQAKSLLETKEPINVSETSPYCITAEPENLENRVEFDTMEVKSMNSVTEPVSLENMKQSVSTSFETTGNALITLPVEANSDAKDSVTTLGFLAMVVGKDFEATSEFLNTAKVKASEKSPKHTDMKGGLVCDSEKMIIMKDLHKPLQLESRTETSPETEHALSERECILKRSSEFDVEEYRTASLGAEALAAMNELRKSATSPIMMELSELEKPSQHLPIEHYANDLKETVILESMTTTSSKEHSSVVLMETKTFASDFREIDANYLKAKSECETESGNWIAVPELLKTRTTLESSPEYKKALETVIENKRDSEITERSKALINENFPENVSQLKEVYDSEIILETEIVKTQNMVCLRNEENENLENWKKVPESSMSMENTSEFQCIEKTKIVNETSQSDLETQKKEREKANRDVDASSESLHMIFANYSEHNLELNTETDGVKELKKSETILESKHKLDSNNFMSSCTKNIKGSIDAESEVSELQENLKSSHCQVKNVEDVELPVVKNIDTLEAISNRKKIDADFHFTGEVEEEGSDSIDFIKKNKTGAKPTDLVLTLSNEKLIEKDSKGITENELLAKNQGPSFILKPFPKIDVKKLEKIPEPEGIAVIQDLNEARRLTFMAAAIDPKEIVKLKNLASVEAKDDSTCVSIVKQFEGQNLDLLGHKDTQIKKTHLDSAPICAKPSSDMTFSDKFHIQEQKLEERTGITGLKGASESLHHSGRDLIIVPESDKIEVITSEHGTVTKSENILKYFYKIPTKDSKTAAAPVDVKVLETGSDVLLQTDVEIIDDLSDRNSVIASENLESTSVSPRQKILPKSQCISGLQGSDTTFRSETLTHSHLKTASAGVHLIDAENIIKNQEGTSTSLLTTVESVEALKEGFEYTTNVNKLEANQKSLINLESVNKEKISDVHTQLFHENEAFISSHVKSQILEGVPATANKVCEITQEPDAKLVLNYSEVSESTKSAEREKSDTSLTVFTMDAKDSEADSSILDTGNMKHITTIYPEKYSKPLAVLESKSVADVSQSLSKIESNDLRNAVSFEKILEIKHPLTTAVQLTTSTSKSSESVSELELTAKMPELRTNTSYLGVADFKLSDKTAERSSLEITDSDSQIQPENILEVKHFESASESEYVLGTHPFKSVLESGNMTQGNILTSTSDILCSGSNVENLEKKLESKGQETKGLDSPQFTTVMAKDMKGHLTCEEIIDISEKSPHCLSIVKITTTGSDISSVVPKTKEKCTETSLDILNVSDLQGPNANVELDILKGKFPEVTTDVKNSKQDSECIDKMELKSKNAVEPMPSKELSNSVSAFLLTENKTLEASPESFRDTVSSATNIEQNLKSVVTAEGNRQESAVECVILTQLKSAETVPQFNKEVKGSESTSESLCVANKKDLDVAPQISLKEQGTVNSLGIAQGENTELNQPEIMVLKDSVKVVEPVFLSEKEDLKVGEHVIVEMKDSEAALQSECIIKDKDLEVSVQDSSKGQDSEIALKPSDIIKESESHLKDRKSEKISSKSKDKSKSGKKTKKSRSKSPSKSKKRKKKSRSRSTSRQISRRARSRSKNDSGSKKKHSTSHHKSRSKSVDKKEDKDSSLRSRRRRSRTSDRLKSRSRSADRRDSPVRSRRRRSRSSDHRSRSRSVDKRESARRRRRLSRSSDNRKSRSRSVDRRETLTRSRRRRSRSSDRHKSRSRSVDKRETSVRTRRRRSQSSDRCKSRSKSRDRRESPIRTRRRQSRSSDRKSRSRSPDDKREFSVRTRRRRSRTPETRKSRSRSVDRRDISGRGRRRRSRSSDNRKSRSRSVDKRESSVRVRRRRSRSSDNRRSKSKSTDRRETSVRRKRRRSVSSDRKSRSKSVDKRDTSARSKRRRSRSSDNCKSRSKSVENTETSAKSRRRRSKSTDRKSRANSVEKESSLKSRHRRSKSLDRPRSKTKSRSKSSERRKEKDSDGSRGNRSKYRSKSKSLEKTDGTECLEATLNNQEKPELRKSKSRSRSKSIEKTEEKENLRRSRSKGSKSPESRSRRHRTASRSRRNRSRSLTRKRSRSKSDHRSQSRSRTRSRSRSRRWRRTRSRSLSRHRSLSRKRHRRSRRNRSRSTDRRRRRSDSRDSYRISLRLRSRSRSPVRLRSTGRRRSTSKSPDHRRSRSSSRSPKRLTDLDKAQLLEIAKANAAAMCAKAGVPLPPSLMPVITPEKKEEKVTQKTAKETILELTEKCKKIAQSQDDVIVNKPHVSDEEEEEHPFINHPFKLSEPKPIFFNLTTPTIKPAPPKNQVTLTKEFPVSSGSQHRKKEADSAYGEWVPVEKNNDENKDDVFPNPANLEPVDISSALNERTIAQKRLTENTFDLEAMCLLNRAQERIDAWAELNSIPGHFTGSTGAQVLSSEQLSNSGPQAWVKKVDDIQTDELNSFEIDGRSDNDTLRTLITS